MARVKICGITRHEDAELAAALGAWAIGFIFWPGSKRRCDEAVAAGIARALRRQVEPVGVFVNPTLDEVAQAAEGVGLTHVQLHGDEGPAFCAAVAQRTGARVIKALRIGSGADIRDAERFHTDFHLLDAAAGAALRRHRPHVGLGAGRAAPLAGAGDPVRRPDARERRRGHRRRAPVGGRRRLRRRVRAGDQGPGQGRGVHRRGVAEAAAGEVAERVERARDRVSSTASGPYGGQYVPETLMPALAELEAAWIDARDDEGFRAELGGLLRDFAGRPTPLYHAERLSEAAGHPVYLKREDLLHTGAHKINNALGQCLLAKRMGKTRIIAETGAGQHGVATATACALLGIECVVYMGTEDMRRQRPNVQRMGLLGATVAPVDAGARTLKEAVSAAIRDWVANVGDTHYVIGSCVGPAPFPALVRDLQRVIGDEARAQILERAGRLPDRVIACVGGGSNAIGTFIPFVDDADVALVGVEAAGDGIDTGRHGAPLTIGGRGGVLHGAYSAIMQDEDGQILEAHSISAGLDYPGTGPEHAYLRDTGRARYDAVTDDEALAALQQRRRARGDHPGARVLARGRVGARPGADAGPDTLDLICLSGRGDKDLAEVLPEALASAPTWTADRRRASRRRPAARR